jgi:hypothetical protein
LRIGRLVLADWERLKCRPDSLPGGYHDRLQTFADPAGGPAVTVARRCVAVTAKRGMVRGWTRTYSM